MKRLYHLTRLIILTLSITGIFFLSCTSEYKEIRTGCLLNSDCEESFLCIKGSCVPECRYDDDCGTESICTNHQCVPDRDTIEDSTGPDIIEDTQNPDSTEDSIEDSTQETAPDTEDTEPTDIIEAGDTDLIQDPDPEAETAEDTLPEEPDIPAEAELFETPLLPLLYEPCDIFRGCHEGTCLPVFNFGIGFCTTECTEGVCPGAPLDVIGIPTCRRAPGYPRDPNTCLLVCQNDSDCPEGLGCHSQAVCNPDTPKEIEPYQLCTYMEGCSSSTCLFNNDLSAGVCARGCAEVTACPTAPSGITAAIDCARMGTSNSCVLTCAVNEDCPSGQICETVQNINICMAPPSPHPAPWYQPCDDLNSWCAEGTCVTPIEGGTGTCMMPCTQDSECPLAPEGFISPICTLIEEEMLCVLGCVAEQICPSGRLCDSVSFTCL